jgi:hypothetical protein
MPSDNSSDIEKGSFDDIKEEPEVPKIPDQPKVVFGNDGDISAHDRLRGVEIRREMTREEKELAAAGYDHLDEKSKPKQKSGEKESFEKVDIIEHEYPLSDYSTKFSTDLDIKDPAQSKGLTQAEADARLARDGKNLLTPPKKKSALRKASYTIIIQIIQNQ